MHKTATLILLSVVCLTLAGCQSEVPKHSTAAPQPAQSSTQPIANSPKKDDCDAIADPVLSEDCRFTKKVEAEKKRHNVDPVVTHSPGSINQP